MVITVYSKDNCPQCTATKRWLNERDIPFTEADATDEMNLAAIKALGHMSAPVIIVAKDGPGSEVDWSGFNPIMLKEHVLGPRWVEGMTQELVSA